MEKIPVHLWNAFVVFNESTAMTSAASKLGISQPALSKQLKQLESFLPEPLFTAQGRKKVLTRFGSALNSNLKEKLNLIPATVDATLKQFADPKQTTLRIAARRGILDRIAEPLKFQGSLHFLEMSHAQIIDSLLKQKADIGITHEVPDTSELVAKPLFREEFRLIIPKHLVPHKPTLNRDLLIVLSEMPALSFKPQDELISTLYLYFQLQHKTPLPFRATENYVSLVAMAKAGVGWTIAPSHLDMPETRHWVLQIPSRILAPRLFHLLYRKEVVTARWFKQLATEIKECF